MHGAYPVIVYILQFIIEPAFTWCIHEFVSGLGGCIAFCSDKSAVDLCVRSTLAPGTVEVETGVVNLRSRLPSQDNFATGNRPCLEGKQGNDRG